METEVKGTLEINSRFRSPKEPISSCMTSIVSEVQ